VRIVIGTIFCVGRVGLLWVFVVARDLLQWKN